MTAGQWPPPERPDRPAHDSGPGPTATGPSGLGSAAAGPSGPGPRTPRPPQPLQLARALLILFLVRIGLLIMSEFGVEAAVWGRRAMEVRDPLLHTLIGLGTSGLALLSGGVWAACLALAIVMIVRARDTLRNGAIVLLIALVVPTFFVVDLSGGFGPPVVAASYILELVFSALALIISAVGAVFLLRAYRSAAQEESSRYAMF